MGDFRKFKLWGRVATQRLSEVSMVTNEFPIVLSTAFLITFASITFYVMEETYMGILILDASKYCRIQKDLMRQYFKHSGHLLSI